MFVSPRNQRNSTVGENPVARQVKLYSCPAISFLSLLEMLADSGGTNIM